MSLYNAGSSSGNIIGPLLFSSKDAPGYHPGLRGVLGIFIALVAVVLIQAANLVFLNKLQQRKRTTNGKRAIFKDHSMQEKYVPMEEGNVATEGPRIGDNAFLDLTDRKNDEFVYIY